MDKLDTELAYFNAHRSELVERANGKFAPIKGETFVNFFDSPENAYNEGIQRFGNVPFLIKKIAEQDEVVSIPSLPFLQGPGATVISFSSSKTV